jgi:hypothetical protein
VTRGLGGLLGALEAEIVPASHLDPTDAHDVVARHMALRAGRVRAAAAADFDAAARSIDTAPQ